ncbi:MAG: protein kinase [Gracilimonas sp.]|uniref:serine/threonine-protein kinase n=1 Tax=Gracilimonas sp. TaxID=1974203 RepID=UPI001B2188EF|nr:serine/threonine-protein kinase [Gracilimonas sp.]MBO6584825.1 protein kinase [Gracilimonas sp.]MBO6615904.1 protein kinase [Gracilimonas sp.]
MEKSEFEKLEKIIDDVLLHPKEEQKDRIKELCGGDSKLQEQAEELLESIHDSETFLDDQKKNLKSFLDDFSDTEAPPETEEGDFTPETFGFYTTTGKIDQGGMGIVYKGKRSDGEFEREVAIKVLNRRLVSENWEKRFKQEKVILASLEHPNIAKLYDAGISERNRPYLVMEYVRGMSLKEYIQKEEPELKECLSKFKEICEAIEYAHRNLIVHRDIKPQNLLINEQGHVKVLDFGIAKIISEELSEEEVIQTMESGRLLSLSYAAPEQVNMGKITVATDVYALGLVLYEMLAREKPFDLSGKTLQQAEKIILNRETENISAKAKVKLKKIDAKDLDAIVNKCLRKEPEYRYSSVRELLNDLENLQNKKPVAARRNTRRYKTGKFLKRNKYQLSVAAVFFVAIVTFGVIYSINITKEKNRALEALSRAKMVSDVMVNVFEEVDYTKTEDPRLATSRFLDETLNAVDNMFANVPGERARLLMNFGSIKFNLGELKTADSLLTEATAILHALDTENEYRYWLADVFNVKADLARARGQDSLALAYADSLQHFLDKNEQEIRNLEIVPLDWDAYYLAAKSYKAEVYSFFGEFEKADSMYTELFEGYAARNDTTSDVYWVGRHDYGWLLLEKGEYHRAISTFDKVLEARTKGYEIGYAHYTPTKIAGAYASLGWAHHMLGQSNKAEEYSRKALSMYTDIFGENPSIERARAMNDLGIIIQRKGEYEEARELIEKAYYMRKDLLGDTHPLTLTSEGNMGLVYFYNDQKEKALEWFIKAHQSNVKVKGETHPDHMRELSNIGAVYMQLGKNEQAIKYFERALSMGEQFFDTTNVIYRRTLSAYNSIK